MVSADNNNPFAYAKQYREAGWLGTIPLPAPSKGPPPTGKWPPPAGYTGNGAPYPTDKQVAYWAKQKHNIGLRLGDVPGYVPSGAPPQGYELLGLDVDTYGDKNGYEQLQALIATLGALPATVRSSSRWVADCTKANCTCCKSYTALFLVPAGYRYLGKAASCIDVIQKGHRYTVVWPSLNPDAEFATYRFRDPNGAYYDSAGEPVGTGDPSGVPALKDVALLPGCLGAHGGCKRNDCWFCYLTCGGMPATEDPISDLTSDELLTWAVSTYTDAQGSMCRLMEQQVKRQIERMAKTPDSHPNMLNAHWEICRLGAEGHTGWLSAMKMYNNKWHKLATQKRNEDVPVGEVNRSVVGALSKIQPKWLAAVEDGGFGQYMPSDPCVSQGHEVGDNWENGDWLNMMEGDDGTLAGDDDSARIAEMDYSGLGNVIGPMVNTLAQDTDPSKYDMNDRGNGKHFVDVYTDNVKYVSTRKSWVLWDGERWHRDQEDRLVGLAFDVVKRRQKAYASMLPCESKSEIALRRAWANWATKSGNAAQIKNALTLAKQEYVNDDEPVALSGKEFDANPILLGCANGVLELRGSGDTAGQDPVLRPPRKGDFVTYNTRVPYVPWSDEQAENAGLLEAYQLWQGYLDTFLPDRELRKFVQKVMGHMLVGENPEKLIVFVYGPHDTGKSTLLGGISGALGDYYGTVDMKLFRPADLNPGLIRAVPLRVVGMSEVDAGKMDASTIKRMTGNDKVVAEAKYSNEIFEGRPQFTTVIACNNEPDIQGADDALRERVMVLPFETEIPRSMRQYEKQADIEKHSGPAVLAWLVEGWKMYCREGLKRRSWPRNVRKISGEVVSHFNATQTFIHEDLEKYRESEEGMRAYEKAKTKAMRNGRNAVQVSDWPIEWTPSAAHVYERYVRWCQNNNVNAVSKPQFGKDLGVGRTAQRKVEGKTMKVYMGVRFREA